MDRKSQEGQDTVTIDLIEPRTLPTDPSYTQQNFEHQSMDTKLWSLKTAKKAFPSQPTTPPPPPPFLSRLGLVNKIHLLE